MSARVALGRLHARKLIQLARVDRSVEGRSRREAFEPPQLHGSIQELGKVELVEVSAKTPELSRLWNTLMHQFHPLGYQPMAGAQIRYLVHTARGWVGALGWGAAAWSVAARDRHIGWSTQARQKNLRGVVCNWRFLILPTVRVAHLASHVLALNTRRLPEDWQRRYGYAPVLAETFIDPSRHAGTCYRAAGWQPIGSTRGRGRNDRHRRQALAPKKIYLLSLGKSWRQELCQEAPRRIEPRPAEGPSSPDWTEDEWGDAAMTDRRLERRLRTLAADFYRHPQANIPQACGTRAKTKAAYRFMENAEITTESILGPHREATLRRVAAEKVVLAVQDSTAVTYGNRSATEGLGLTNNDHQEAVGFWVHSTLAFTVKGLALGLLDVQAWAREAPEQRTRQRDQQPIEEKESMKWLRGLERTRQCQERLATTQLVSVGDREADIYELFAQARDDGGRVKLLIRVQHKYRRLESGASLWEEMLRQPVAGTAAVRIGRRGPRKERTAQLAMRWADVELKPAKGKARLRPLRICCILAKEVDAPSGVEPVEWMLLTTMPVETLESAIEKLHWYAVRTLIEGFHRTLKSGCRIEKRQLLSGDRLQRCLAIDMVVGWRLQYMSRLGRDHPDQPCTTVFSDQEWQPLYAVVQQTPQLPSTPPTLQAVIRMIASLGGFLGRKSDKEPGTQTLWLGLQRLHDIIKGWEACRELMQRTRGP